MIKPTVGRMIHYFPCEADTYAKTIGEPLAAIIVKVWSDSCVNLAIFDANGGHRHKTSVLLVQDGSPQPDSNYCAWMPFQVGQAQKTEELAKKLDEITPPTVGPDIPVGPSTTDTPAAPSVTVVGDFSQIQLPDNTTT